MTKSSTGSGARRRMETSIRSPEWKTCPAAPSLPTSVTSVISTSRDPQRPSVARNMSAGAVAVSTELSGSTADAGSSAATTAAAADSRARASPLASSCSSRCSMSVR